MGDWLQDRTQGFHTDRNIEQMNGEDEKWEVADNREHEVEEHIEKRLNTLIQAPAVWSCLPYIICEDHAPLPDLVAHVDGFDPRSGCSR